MRRTAIKRIVAVALAAAITLIHPVLVATLQAGAAKLGIGSSSLGLSGDAPTIGQSADGGEEDRAPTLGLSGMDALADAPIMTWDQLKTAIESGPDNQHLVLGDDILMNGKHIVVHEGRTVTIDGLGRHTMRQREAWHIYAGQNSRVTLKDMTLFGRDNYGIVESMGESSKVTFDNIHYTGPQPYYGPGKHHEMIIKGTSVFNIEKWDGGPGAEEFCQNAYVLFEGGNTTINHALADRNTNAVFYMINGDPGKTYIKLTEKAQVTVNTGDYVLYTSLGPVPFILEEGCGMYITAPGYGLDEGHKIGDVRLAEGATFSYKQGGTSNIGSGTRKEMYITGNVSIGKNATFLYESSRGIRPEGTVTMDSPRLVSIYGADAAFYDRKGTYDIKNVNAVNYWTSTTNVLPSDDSALNWPDYMWNTWEDNRDGTYSIGEAFRFSGNGYQGVTSSSAAISDVLDRSQVTLAQTLKFDTTAKRLVVGNLRPFEVDKVVNSQGKIFGNAACSDVMAYYETADNAIVRVHNTSFPLDFRPGTLPKSGKNVTVIANMGGLRAAVEAQSGGVLELVSVPTGIYFGEHALPVNTTEYQRETADPNNGDGKMLIQVLDSRGVESTPWEITLQAVDTAVPGKEKMPLSTLLFRTKDNHELTLSGYGSAITVYRNGKSEVEYKEYNLVWEDSQGLLTKLSPGALGPGQYGVVLNWTLQTVIEE